MLTGKEKATILLSIIGPQKASRLLRQLPEDISKLISAKVAVLPPPSPEMLRKFMEDFSSNISGAPTDEKSLSEAFTRDDDGGDASGDGSETNIIEKITQLSQIQAEKLVSILSKEKKRLVNFVLSILEEDQLLEVQELISSKNTGDLSNIRKDLPIFSNSKRIIEAEIIKQAELDND